MTVASIKKLFIKNGYIFKSIKKKKASSFQVKTEKEEREEEVNKYNNFLKKHLFPILNEKHRLKGYELRKFITKKWKKPLRLNQYVLEKLSKLLGKEFLKIQKSKEPQSITIYLNDWTLPLENWTEITIKKISKKIREDTRRILKEALGDVEGIFWIEITTSSKCPKTREKEDTALPHIHGIIWDFDKSNFSNSKENITKNLNKTSLLKKQKGKPAKSKESYTLDKWVNYFLKPLTQEKGLYQETTNKPIAQRRFKKLLEPIINIKANEFLFSSGEKAEAIVREVKKRMGSYGK